MTDELRPIRRIVTGHDLHGRSSIVEDGSSPAGRLVPERPGYRVTNIWRTLESPTAIDALERMVNHQGVAPPVKGLVCARAMC